MTTQQKEEENGGMRGLKERIYRQYKNKAWSIEGTEIVTEEKKGLKYNNGNRGRRRARMT